MARRHPSRRKRLAHLPLVLTREEVEGILTHLSGTVRSMIRLLYGTGMRDNGVCAPPGDGCRFRAGRDRGPAGKGWEGPHDGLPQSLACPAERPPRRGQEAHEPILEGGYGEVCIYLPDSLSRYRDAPRHVALPEASIAVSCAPAPCEKAALMRYRLCRPCHAAVHQNLTSVPNRVAGVFSPDPTTPRMRVRTGRFLLSLKAPWSFDELL